MSAVVTVSGHFGRVVEVPKVDNYDIDGDGRLRLRMGWGDWTAVFQPDQWEHVVITPERGPNGRFVKKGR